MFSQCLQLSAGKAQHRSSSLSDGVFRTLSLSFLFHTHSKFALLDIFRGLCTVYLPRASVLVLVRQPLPKGRAPTPSARRAADKGRQADAHIPRQQSAHNILARRENLRLPPSEAPGGGNQPRAVASSSTFSSCQHHHHHHPPTRFGRGCEILEFAALSGFDSGKG